MADLEDKTVPELTAIDTPAAGDLIHVVDVSDSTDAATGSSKKSTLQQIADWLASLSQTLTNKILTSPRLNTPKINEDVAVTSSSSELNILDGVTANKDEINLLDGLTVLSGSNTGDEVVATGAEVNGGVDNEKMVTSKAIKDSVIFNTPEGFLFNGKIVTSVSSNNLTLAIKGLDGNDPSSTNPVYVRIGNTVRTISEATSVTKNAGTNWNNSGSVELAGKEVDYFVYLIWEVGGTTKVRIGFSRIPYGRVVGDFSAGTTTEKTINSDMIYANAADECEVIGRFNAILSGTASFNWSIPATSIIIQRPIFETRLLSFTPVVTGFADGTVLLSFNYKIMNNLIWYAYDIQGTSNATTLTYTQPFNLSGYIVTGWITDNGGFQTLQGLLEGSANRVVTVYKTAATGAFTNALAKRIIAKFIDFI